MSAGVSDQRMKGQGNQVSNGPKDHVNEHEDFDSWRAQHHQGYNNAISTSMASDPYLSNYYGTSFPYQAFGVGDGTWSNGGDPMTFLGGYGSQMGHDSYGMDGMFGGGGGGFGTAFGQPAAAAAGFNYFHGNGDYSTWAAPSRKYDDYYRSTDGVYGTATPAGVGGSGGMDGLKGVEQGMQGLGLSEGSVGNGGVAPGVMKVVDGKDMSKQQGQQDVVKTSGMDTTGMGGVGGMVTVQTNVGSTPAPPKKMTWASIASQPAKPQPPVSSGGMKKKGPGMPPPPMVPGKHNMDIGTWEGKNGGSNSMSGPKQPVGPPPTVRPAWGGPVRGGGPRGAGGPPGSGASGYPGAGAPPHHTGQVAILPGPHHPHHPHHPQANSVGPPPHHHMQQPPPTGPHPGGLMVAAPLPSHPVLDELRVKNNYNPPDFDMSAKGARFFVIKSYSEDDIHRSIKYEIWCSTEHGNKRLDQAFRERESKGGGPVFLFFSVNGSGHFCGMAQMVSPVDYHASSSVWSQDKWKGQFRVRWVYVKDVPNVQLRHIRLENNENKPVTNSRDTQEVPFEKGKQVLRILHGYQHSTSIFDDFVHYEKRQEEEDNRKVDVVVPPGAGRGGPPQGHMPPQQKKCYQGDIQILPREEEPINQRFVVALAESIIEGNEIHEWLLRHGKLHHVNMTVPEAVTAAGSSMRFICEWKSLVYLLDLEESLYEQMTETLAEWHRNPPPRRGSDLYVVLIADNRSVLFIFQKDMEKVTLVDSHQHLNHGAMVAQVPGARLEQLCVWYNNVLRNYYGSRPECFELSFLYFKRYEAGEMATG